MGTTESTQRRSAWVLGFVTSFCTGPSLFPVNLQATFVYGTAFVILWLRVRREKRPLRDSPHLFLALGILLALSFAFATNTWVLIALYGSVIFLGIDFVLRGFSPQRYESLPAFALETLALALSFVKKTFSRTTMAQFLSAHGTHPRDESSGPSRRRLPVLLVSIAGGIFLAYIFHLLFASVNEDYARFMGAFMEWVWSVLLKDLLFGIFYSYLLFALFGAERSKPREAWGRKLPVVTAVGALIAVILVTGIFSVFQTKLIVVDVPELRFSDLSKYTQQGFLQLVIAIVLGYCVALLAVHTRRRAQGPVKLLSTLTFFFIAELLLAAAFSAHKIGLLQKVFGFKDERILASVGILFIVFSFVLLIIRSLSEKSDAAGLRFQIWFLLVAALGVNVWSVDLIATTVHPIRYFKDGKPFEDHSYLFGNSYDNAQEWPRLIDEMRTVDALRPGAGYFWGHESSGRSDVFGGTYTPLCVQADLGPSDPRAEDEFEEHLPTRLLMKASEKYAHRFQIHSPGNFRLQWILDFNFREHRASAFAESDSGEMRRFRSYLVEYCRPEEEEADLSPGAGGDSSDWIPYRRKEKWGFADRNRRIVIEPKYSQTWPMRHGLARALLKDKYGWVNISGRESGPFPYDGADDLVDGLARVYAAGKWGFVNADGKEVVPPRYDAAGPSRSGLALVKLNGKWGMIDAAGRELLPPLYTSIDPAFNDGLARVMRGTSYGFIDMKGAEIIPAKYERAHPFQGGFAAVRSGKWGFVDKLGKEVIPPIYDDVRDFREGFAAVARNGKWGFVDATSREVVGLVYDGAGDFHDGAAVVLSGSLRGIVNQRGLEVTSPQYEKISAFSDGLAKVRHKGQISYIDATGKIVIPPRLTEGGAFKNGIAAAGLTHWTRGFVDKSGREIVPMQYDRVEVFHEGLARVRANGRFGYVDTSGRVVIPLRYDSAGDFFGGIAQVKRNQASGYIDRNGTEFWDD